MKHLSKKKLKMSGSYDNNKENFRTFADNTINNKFFTVFFSATEFA